MSTAPQARPRCSACGDTGFRPAPHGKGVVRCVHGEKAAPELVRWHRTPISVRELRRQVQAWLADNRGPSGVPFTADQARLLRLLGGHLGQQQAIRLEQIARVLDNRPDRYIKQLVHDLRVLHRIKVGSLRGYRRKIGAPQSSQLAGCFLCLTDRERLITYTTGLHEALSRLEVCDAMTDGRYGLQQLIARARGAVQGELNFGAKS